MKHDTSSIQFGAQKVPNTFLKEFFKYQVCLQGRPQKTGHKRVIATWF